MLYSKPYPLNLTLSDKELVQIVHRVADVYNVRPHLLMGRRRYIPLAEARQMAMVIAYKRIGNYMEVGRLFNRHHGNVIHAKKRILDLLTYDKKVIARWRNLCDLAVRRTPPETPSDYQI